MSTFVKTPLHSLVSGNSRAQQTPVIVAIDVGYGYVKSASPCSDGFKLDLFVSLAPRYENSAQTAKDIASEARKTTIVNVRGNKYEVGEDAELCQTVSGARRLEENYTETDEYLALMYGALVRINKPKIDLLVTGLPVNHMRYESKIENLKKLLRGRHQITSDFSVEISDVHVTTQPLGGLFDYAFNSRIDDFNNARFLTIDPGQFTFDWVTSQGLKKIDKLSDSHTISMRKVVDAIQRNIGKELRSHFNAPTEVERALQSGHIYLKGRKRSIQEFIDDSVLEIPRQAVQKMIGHLDELALLRLVLLVGGGAELFLPAVKEALPGYEIVVADQSILSIVRGYYLAGISSYMRRQNA